MKNDNTLDEAAEKYGIEMHPVQYDNKQSMVLGLFTRRHAEMNFKDGAAFGEAIGARKEREKILGMLREIGPYDGPYRDGDGFADWIEERLK